ANDGKDRSKDLFAGDGHARFYVVEDGRTDKESLFLRLHDLASITHWHGPFRFALVDISDDLFVMFGGNQRAHLCTLHSVTDGHFFSLFHEKIEQWFGHIANCDQYASCEATLTGRPERGAHDGFDALR